MSDSLRGGREKRCREHRGANKHLNAPDGAQRVRQKLPAVRGREAGLDQRVETEEQAGDLAGEDKVDAAAEQHHQTYDPKLHVHGFTKTSGRITPRWLSGPFQPYRLGNRPPRRTCRAGVTILNAPTYAQNRPGDSAVNRSIRSLFAVLSLAMSSLATSAALAADAPQENAVLDLKMKALDGKEVDLADYKGKVVLIVNVASKCGLTLSLIHI